MYEAFYGLTNTPFTRAIPTGELYPAFMMEEILGRLEHAAKSQLFAVVTQNASCFGKLNECAASIAYCRLSLLTKHTCWTARCWKKSGSC